MQSTNYWYLFLFVLLFGGVACSSETQPEEGESTTIRVNNFTKLAPYFNAQWAMDKWWEDSLAEVATYAAEQTIGDTTERFECTLITAKEEFSLQYNVITNDVKHKNSFPVIKVNQLYTLTTDKYPQHCLLSMVFRRDQPVPLYKLTASAQDGYGNTFKTIADDGLQYVETYNSYQEQQGAGQRQVRHDVLFEEALVYTLRTLRFDQLPAFETQVRAAQPLSEAHPPMYYTAQVRVADGLLADTAEPAWRVTVDLNEQRANVYWFAKKYPNPLLRQTTWNGYQMTLKNVHRVTY